MNERSSEILILGGGVTGMSAALALKDQQVAVHLVEKSDRLGGNAAKWACMATTTCQNCGACLVQEMAAALRSQSNAKLHTGTTVTGLSSGDGGLTATLSDGRTLSPAAVIMATGFTPFDPAAISSYHTGTCEKVITTAQLNTLIREETLTSMTGPAPRIAFLQCVGSRDRKENRDYCSQVCCRVSMRHARKLLHLLPGAKISLFYMDLQIIGKEARTAARDLAGSVDLIQGVPAEILENRESGGLTMVVEDPATRARISREFDLIVLSVGMTPAADNGKTCDRLGITPNAWGFFNTEDTGGPEEIIVAGCARGPKDILASRQEGQMAAAEAIRTLDKGRPETAATLPGIAVIGGGSHALAAASAVASRGYPAYSFGHHSILPPGIRDFGTAKILAIDGYNGNFTIFYEKEGKKEELRCGAVIASPSPGRRNRAAQFPNATTLDTFAETAPKDRPGSTLMLLDYFGPENKTFSRMALEEAAAARGAGKIVYVLMTNMLVHGPSGQQAYDNARKAGVRFLRVGGPEDLTITAGKGGITVSLKEATLPGRDISLAVDCLVIPDTITPATSFKETAGLLRVDMDSEGYLQSPNVRHRLIHSPRRGIFFAGPCHDETDEQDLAAEIQAIMADLELGRRAAPLKESARVSINEKTCAMCLTCYRVCPHGAVVLNAKSKPQIMPEACFSCQACVSNCPAYAVEAQGFDNETIAAGTGKGRTMILACERSGALAAGTLPPETDLFVIPCACRVSADMLMRPLIKGADRVIVSGCHQGNCRSADGNLIARKQVEKVAAMPGVGEGKLKFQAAAANESPAFARMIS